MADKKRTEPDNRYAPEHPEDKAGRIESSKLAVEQVDSFAESHSEDLRALLWVYGDEQAVAQLRALRELFWSTLT